MLQKKPGGRIRQHTDEGAPEPVVPFRVSRRAKGDRGKPAPWENAFLITPAVDEGPGAILLAQVTDRQFLLGSTIRFRDEFDTGLEKIVSPATIELIRELGPDTLGETDLGSIPGAFGWFLSSYGTHTPAVLIHDRLIGWDSPPENEKWTDQYADRYLRYMLKASGVSWLTRWLMWTAVAFRTRWVAPQHSLRRRIGLILWGGAAAVGIGSAAVALIQFSWGTAAWIAISLPLPAALLWGKQAGAGLLAVVCGPLVLPPALAGVIGYSVYHAADRVATAFGRVFRSRRSAVATSGPDA